MDPPRRGGSCEAAEGVASPAFPPTRKIPGLLEAVMVLGYGLTRHDTSRREACHWILSRLRLPANPVPLPPLEMTGSGQSHASRGLFSPMCLCTPLSVSQDLNSQISTLFWCSRKGSLVPMIVAAGYDIIFCIHGKITFIYWHCLKTERII